MYQSFRTVGVLGVFLSYIGISAYAQTPAPSPASDVQRIPRQTSSTTAAAQGIFRTQSGLGLGSVRVLLAPEDGGMSVTTNTTGDGVFRMLDLRPGRYLLTATLVGYLPVLREGIELRAGEVFVLEQTLLPEAGAPEPASLPVPELPSVYRNVPLAPLPPASVSIAASPTEITPSDKIFTRASNRWEYDFPEYRRYSPPTLNTAPKGGDVQYTQGRWYDPFNTNRLKGDAPIFGQQTFLNLLLASDTNTEGRRLPTTSNLASADPDAEEVFGRFGQFFLSQNFSLSADLFHGDTSYRPADWRVKFTPEFNINYFKVRENGIVSVDPRRGTTRLDTKIGIQEAFVEARIKSLSTAFDFVSVRAGIQTFNSDFRGFIFFDQEPGVRIFGNLRSNRYQYNLAYFTMLEKDSNSGLNSMSYRGRQVFVANLYRQDFIKPGYTIQASFHYDKDDATLQFDTNRFLVRPAAIGIARPHKIRSYYYGLTGDGHIGRINITHAFYQVLGYDSRNLIAGKRTDINAQMAAAEASIDKDWFRLRASVFFSSGDDNPRDGTARGFDAILDNTSFGGGIFSFWNREGIRLTGSGVALVHGGSLIPSLRSSKTQGQASFVNPGLILYNAGMDVELTPKLRAVLNFSTVQFHHTQPLELLLFQAPIRRGVGADTGLGFLYRPEHSDNIVFQGGFNAFAPFGGFRDIYTTPMLYSVFSNVRFQF
ncbi:MAG: carboxypeptidase-like regulatory domain-containing protein [Acidobacteriota bacterium]